MDGNENSVTSASVSSHVPSNSSATTVPAPTKPNDAPVTSSSELRRVSEDVLDASLATQVHFEKRPQVQEGEVYARYLFNIRQQEAGESFGSFLDSLQALSSCCNFDLQQDSLVRDRIVVGLQDGDLRGKLLQEPGLTLLRCIEVCQEHEALSSTKQSSTGTRHRGTSRRSRTFTPVSDLSKIPPMEVEWCEESMPLSGLAASGITALLTRTPSSAKHNGFSQLQGLTVVDTSCQKARSASSSSPATAAAAASASQPSSAVADVGRRATRQSVRETAKKKSAENCPGPLPKRSRPTREKCRYRCRECSKNFADAEALQAHLEIQHGKIENVPVDVTETYMYTCKCGKTYREKAQLLSHRCRLRSTEAKDAAVPASAASQSEASSVGQTGNLRSSSKDPSTAVPKLEFPEFSDDDSESFHVDIPDQDSSINNNQSDEEAEELSTLKNKPIRKRWRGRLKAGSDEKFARRCPHCDKGFTEADVRSQKFYAHRRGCKKVECEVCKVKVSEGYLAKHMVSLHRSSDFKCTTCGGVFVSQAELKSHWISSGHPADGNSPTDSVLTHVCHICHRVFSSFAYLARHLQTFVHDKPPEYSCSLCGRSVTSRVNLHIHMYRKHSKELKIDYADFFTCKCGLGFVQKENLAKHRLLCRKPWVKNSEKMSVVGNSAENLPQESGREFTCHTCRQIFTVWADFDHHVTETGHDQSAGEGTDEGKNVNEAGGEETYTCRLCQEKFSDKDDLTSHLLSEAHQGDLSSLQCPMCKKLYKTKYVLQSHLKIHSKDQQSKRKSRPKNRKKLFTSRPSDLESGERPMEQASSSDSFTVDGSPDSDAVAGEGGQGDAKMADADVGEVVRRCPHCNLGFTMEDLRNQKYYAHKRGCKKVQCSVCSVVVSESYLARHMVMMHKQSKFECKTCSAMFVNMIDLKSHWHSTKHPPTEGMSTDLETDHVCHICHKVFTSLAFLTRHLQSYVHEKPQVFKCSICSASISNRMNLHIHMFRKHGKDQGKNYKEFYTCLCGMGFIDRNELAEHKTKCKWKSGKARTANLATEKDQRCDECEETFPDKSTFDDHILETGHVQRSQEEEEEADDDDSNSMKGEYPCKLCNETFTTKRRLTRHMFGPAHQENPSNPQCHICQKIFKHKNYLREHLQTHSEERPFVCEVCGKGFKKSTTLCNHRIIHTGSRTCKCEFCGREFRQQAYLKKHRRLHTGERPYQCHLCGQRFHINSHLLHHVRLHSGERPYTCETCGKSFAKMSQLKGHKATHTDERPWPCGTCGKAFKTQRQMKAHEFLHTGIKQFVCQACGMSFARTSNLSQHMHKYHPELARSLYPQKYRQPLIVSGSSSPPPPPPPPPPLNTPLMYPQSSLALSMGGTLSPHEMPVQSMSLMNPPHHALPPQPPPPPQQLQLHPPMPPPSHFQTPLSPHPQYNMMG